MFCRKTTFEKGMLGVRSQMSESARLKTEDDKATDLRIKCSDSNKYSGSNTVI